MKKLAVTLGLVLGIIMVLVAGGFGVGLLVAMSSRSGVGSGVLFFIVLALLVLALITMIGVFKLNRPDWLPFYLAYCFILGVASLVAYFIMRGAIGLYMEGAIFIMGILFICLGVIVNKIPR